MFWLTESGLQVGTSDKVLGNTELLLCHCVHDTGDVEREWLVEHNRPLSRNTLLAAFVTDADKRECFASNTAASKDAEMLNPSTVVNQDTAFVVLNTTQQLNIKIQPGTVAKSNTDTEAVQEYLVLVAQHNGAWLKNMTTSFDSDDFLESITAVVVGTWGARDAAHVLTELPHSGNCLAGVLCFVESAKVTKVGEQPYGNGSNKASLLAAQLVAVLLVAVTSR